MASPTDTEAPPRVSFVSLGCPKNLIDSEVLLGHLVKGGFTLVGDGEDSDVVVINTCGFLQASEKESMDTIAEMVKRKQKGRLKAVVVAGCLPQRHGEGFARRLKNVDAVLGITGREKIAEICEGLLDRVGRRKTAQSFVSGDLPKYEVDRDRLPLTARHTAYLRLSEGCNHTCAFCIIPKIRGPFRSKPMEVVVDEAAQLAARGVKELNLIAQDLTNYGLDLYRKLCLEELLEKLAAIRGVEWIRLLYAYPTFVTDRLIAAVADLPKVVKYIDMPIQHTRDRVLRLMRRGITEKRQKDLIAKWRSSVPGLVFRTTVIVGFPGETEADFDGLMGDLAELRFERLGAFQYSAEPGTAAHGMACEVSASAKAERFDRLMRQQQEIVFAHNRSWIGREVRVIVERKAKKSLFEGRTYGDAPEIDTTIALHGAAEEGEIRLAKITGFQDYDLIGELK